MFSLFRSAYTLAKKQSDILLINPDRFKRFAILVLILLFLVGCSQQPVQESADPQTTAPPVNNNSVPSHEVQPQIHESEFRTGTLVFVAVDSSTYSQLKLEIDRYVNDVQKDLNLTVALKTYDSAVDPKKIKQDIVTEMQNKKLEGIVLIGAIPFIKIVQSPTGDYPSDVVYFDLQNTCDYDAAGNIESSSLWNKCGYMAPFHDHQFWIGRITPPQNGMQLLKNYFKRNHEYRMGTLQYDKKMLAYLQIVQADVNTGARDNVEQEFRDSLKRGWLYSQSSVDLLIPTDKTCSMDGEYLNKLDQESYESVFVNAHGAPTMHECDITSDTIKKHQPKALFYEFRSCSVGDFSNPDYLAGQYLFNGNGLVVSAPPTVVFGASVVDEGMEYLLSRGMTFGDAYRSVGNANTWLLGDPTLRLRYNVQGNAKISVNVDQLKLDKLPVCQRKPTMDFRRDCGMQNVTFVIQNIGSKELTIKSADMVYNYTPDTIPETGGAMGTVALYKPYEFDELHNFYVWYLSPGENVTVAVVFWPHQKGTFGGKVRIWSDDPTSPLTYVPFTASTS
ncbi:hypothetical protein HYY72_00370 [Candidatus Woesearchaeota archaeon]|nr:hypothetical protein [Candidatus Woesearchaeota archaeon]